MKETSAGFAEATRPSELESVTSEKGSARCPARSIFKSRLLIFALASSGWCASAFADIKFVQLTDPHIFDGKDDIAGNKEALKWSVDEINRGQGKGKNYQFVVVTGDLGLEGLADYLNPEKQHSGIVSAAHELASYLKPSKVGKWLFVPGNNDLVEENPATIGIYREFIQALKSELPEIEDISREGFELADGNTNYRFIGFDNASFKANDASIDAECFDSTRLDELQRVAGLVQGAPGFVYLFYHVPGIDDPYYASLSPEDPKLKARANGRGQFGRGFPLSAWTVTPAVRDQWNALLRETRIKALFAGHFHSAERKDYEDPARMNSASYLERGKLFICPPLASKKQEGKNPQARGLSLVTLQPDGNGTRTIVWLNQPSPSPSPSPQLPEKKCAKERGRDSGGEKSGIHQALNDIESFLKSLALLLGTIAGFWAWLRYMLQSSQSPRMHLEQTVTRGEGETSTFNVTLRIDNVGDDFVEGYARTAVHWILPPANAGELVSAVGPEAHSVALAPGESAKFLFVFVVPSQQQKSRRFLIRSSFTRAAGWLWRRSVYRETSTTLDA